MRNPDRIDKFCAEFARIWKAKQPDIRFGQLCSNFFGWLYNEKGKDLFFPEEDEMLKYFKEYVGLEDGDEAES